MPATATVLGPRANRASSPNPPARVLCCMQLVDGALPPFVRSGHAADQDSGARIWVNPIVAPPHPGRRPGRVLCRQLAISFAPPGVHSASIGGPLLLQPAWCESSVSRRARSQDGGWPPEKPTTGHFVARGQAARGSKVHSQLSPKPSRAEAVLEDGRDRPLRSAPRSTDARHWRIRGVRHGSAADLLSSRRGPSRCREDSSYGGR
jgi:hypothetical protein